MGAHRRAGAHHRLYRQDRDRPEHPHVAGAGDCRRAAGAARSRIARDGRYRSGPVRPGNVRIAVDAANGAAAGARRGLGPRDVDRSRGGAVERRSVHARCYGWADRRAGALGRVRRDHEGAEACRRSACRRVAVDRRAVEDAGNRSKEGRRRGVRDRPPSLHAGHHASGDVVWKGYPARIVHRYADVDRRQRAPVPSPE